MSPFANASLKFKARRVRVFVVSCTLLLVLVQLNLWQFERERNSDPTQSPSVQDNHEVSTPAAQKQKLYIFFKHLRKASGTSTRRMLISALNGTNKTQRFHLKEANNYLPANVHYYEQEWGALDKTCIRRLGQTWSNMLSIVVIRDPLERLWSEFWYAGTKEKTWMPHGPLLFEKWLNTTSEKMNKRGMYYANYVSRMLLGSCQCESNVGNPASGGDAWNGGCRTAELPSIDSLTDVIDTIRRFRIHTTTSRIFSKPCLDRIMSELRHFLPEHYRLPTLHSNHNKAKLNMRVVLSKATLMRLERENSIDLRLWKWIVENPTC